MGAARRITNESHTPDQVQQSSLVRPVGSRRWPMSNWIVTRDPLTASACSSAAFDKLLVLSAGPQLAYTVQARLRHGQICPTEDSTSAAIHISDRDSLVLAEIFLAGPSCRDGNETQLGALGPILSHLSPVVARCCGEVVSDGQVLVSAESLRSV